MYRHKNAPFMVSKLKIQYKHTEHLPNVAFEIFMKLDGFHCSTVFILRQNVSNKGYVSQIVYFE